MIPQQADLAKALGIHPSVVTRDKARGMPVDSIESARQWRLQHVRARIGTRPPVAFTPAPAQTSSAPPAPAPAPAPAPGQPPASAEPDPTDGHYWQSRARREQAEAALAELKLAEQRGLLVRVADVRTAHSRRLAGLREAMLQIPARMAAVLAAEADQARCHDLLQAELHGVLEVLAHE